MPTYEYNCEKCDQEYSIIKSMKSYDGKDPCPGCGNIGDRIISPNILFTGTSVQDAEFNHGLGEVTKSAAHRKELAKRKGMIEVGNECLKKHEKELANDKKKRIAKGWDNA